MRIGYFELKIFKMLFRNTPIESGFDLSTLKRNHVSAGHYFLVRCPAMQSGT